MSATAYTADDERIMIFDVVANESTWRIRDLDGKVLRELHLDNTTNVWTWKRDWVLREGSPLASVSAAEGVRYIHPDHLGTTRVLTDSVGNQVASFDFFPFGELAAQSGATEEVLQYTGHERDANKSGSTDNLDYMHARYYSPHLGRFLRVDPIFQLKRTQRNPQLWNRYSYVVGNPLGYTDPTGEILVAEGDQESVLSLVQDALIEAGAREIAEQLVLKEVDEEVIITTTGVDLAGSSNSTVALIGAAMNTSDHVAIRLSSRSLSSVGGARTLTVFDANDPNRIRIELNLKTVAETVVPGVVDSGPLAGNRVGLSFTNGTALVHELGHAFGYFAEGHSRFPVLGQTNSTALRFENSHRKLMAEGPWPVLRRLRH